MTEEEKKAVKTVEEDIEVYKQKGLWKENSILVKSLRIILNLIEKQDKMIDLMAEMLTDFDFDKMCENCRCNICTAYEDRDMYMQCIKEYFRKKVENGRNKI